MAPHQCQMHVRRRARSPQASCHTYRRSLMRRLGMSCALDRPACMMDTLTRNLLDARLPDLHLV